MGKNVLKGATRTASKQQTNNQSEEQIGGVIRSFLGTGPSVDDMLDLPAPRSGSRNRVDLHATNASISSSLQFLPSARDSTLIEKYKPQNPAPHLASCFPTSRSKFLTKPRSSRSLRPTLCSSFSTTNRVPTNST